MHIIMKKVYRKVSSLYKVPFGNFLDESEVTGDSNYDSSSYKYNIIIMFPTSIGRAL